MRDVESNRIHAEHSRGDFRDVGGCSHERMCGEGEHRFVLRNLYTVLDLL